MSDFLGSPLPRLMMRDIIAAEDEESGQIDALKAGAELLYTKALHNVNARRVLPNSSNEQRSAGLTSGCRCQMAREKGAERVLRAVHLVYLSQFMNKLTNLRAPSEKSHSARLWSDAGRCNAPSHWPAARAPLPCRICMYV